MLSARAGVIMLSTSTFFANTVEPAPINVILGINYFSFLIVFSSLRKVWLIVVIKLIGILYEYFYCLLEAEQNDYIPFLRT